MEKEQNPFPGGGWTNLFEKYEWNWIISPGKGKNKKCLKVWNHHLVFQGVYSQVRWTSRENLPGVYVLHHYSVGFSKVVGHLGPTENECGLEVNMARYVDYHWKSSKYFIKC